MKSAYKFLIWKILLLKNNPSKNNTAMTQLLYIKTNWERPTRGQSCFNFYQQQAERINHHKSGIDGGDKAESKLNPKWRARPSSPTNSPSRYISPRKIFFYEALRLSGDRPSFLVTELIPSTLIKHRKASLPNPSTKVASFTLDYLAGKEKIFRISLRLLLPARNRIGRFLFINSQKFVNLEQIVFNQKLIRII